MLLKNGQELLQGVNLEVDVMVKPYRGFKLGPVLLLSSQDLPRSYWVMHRMGLGAFVQPRLGRVLDFIQHNGLD